jgi:integrase
MTTWTPRRSPGGNVKDRIIAFLAHCRQQGNCLRTLEKKRMRLQAFHTASGMPVKIPFIKCPSPLPEIYTQSELDAIFTHAGEYTLLFRAFLQSGLRANEMAHLRPANLLARGLQVTPFDGWSPKSGQERTVVVPSALTTELRTAAKGATVFEMTMYAMLRVFAASNRFIFTCAHAGTVPSPQSTSTAICTFITFSPKCIVSSGDEKPQVT